MHQNSRETKHCHFFMGLIEQEQRYIKSLNKTKSPWKPSPTLKSMKHLDENRSHNLISLVLLGLETSICLKSI